MEYSISALAKLSGVSSRTLRYYDEIGLLKPVAVSHNGYRIYGAQEADRLQQILYFKAFGLSLDTIQSILVHSDTEVHLRLLQQYQQLVLQRQELDAMIAALADTLATYKGEKHMSDQEKFTFFKHHTLPENHALYGDEAKETYGADVVVKSQQMWHDMPEDTYTHLAAEEAKVLQSLAHLLKDTPPVIPSNQAEAAFTAHKNWLIGAAPFYSVAYHRTLGDMYISDPRFTAYYDQKAGNGASSLLKQVIDYYTQRKPN